MNDLFVADAWMHNVLSSNTPMDVCEKKFREFNLIQNTFIRNEIQNVIIPELYKRGYMDAVETYKKMLVLLEEIIAEKQ